MASKETNLVLKLNLAHLTKDECDWLHELMKRLTLRINRQYLKDKGTVQ